MTPICNKRSASIISRTKRSFSLIELMIACLLLALCSGASLINFKAGYDDRQAKNVVKQIERKLELASLLAQVMHDRVYVVIQGKSPVQIFLDPGEGRYTKRNRLLCKAEKLDAVQGVFLESTASATEPLRIAFYPWGIETTASTLHVRFLSSSLPPAELSLEKYAPKITFATDTEIEKIFPEECLTKNEPSH